MCDSHTARPQNLQMAFASWSHLVHFIGLCPLSCRRAALAQHFIQGDAGVPVDLGMDEDDGDGHEAGVCDQRLLGRLPDRFCTGGVLLRMRWSSDVRVSCRSGAGEDASQAPAGR